MRLEHKYVPFELKSVGAENGALTFEGYGSVFNTVDSFGDTIVKGAFARSLAKWKARGKLPKMLLQHGGGVFATADDMVPVGKYTQMFEDDYGLFTAGRVFNIDTDRVKALEAAMREGELDGQSIGFNVADGGSSLKSGIREISDIDLWEVSLVTFPANDPARLVDVRSAGDLPSERTFEHWLAKVGGFSAREVETIISKGYRQLKRGGSVPGDEAREELLASVRRYAAIPS